MNRAKKKEERRITVRTLPRTMSGMPGGLIRTFTEDVAKDYIRRGWVEPVNDEQAKGKPGSSKPQEVSAATG